MRRVRVVALPGTLVAARFPAAVGAGKLESLDGVGPGEDAIERMDEAQFLAFLNAYN